MRIRMHYGIAVVVAMAALVLPAGSAQAAVHPPTAQPAELGPMDNAGKLEIIAPETVRRGATWDLTVRIAEVQSQGGVAGPTLVLLTDLTGLGGVQILRPVSIASMTGTQQERIAKNVRPGRYLIRVVFQDSWTRRESTALRPITVTR